MLVRLKRVGTQVAGGEDAERFGGSAQPHAACFDVPMQRPRYILAVQHRAVSCSTTPSPPGG